MNRDVSVKTSSSADLYNSILVDEYQKFIFGDDKMVDEKENSAKMAVTQTQWEEGMNVRAPYIVDGEEQYFEAKILRIFDHEFVKVVFHGYDEEKIVRLTDLKNSEGDEAIQEQMKAAEEEYVYENDGDEGEEEEEEEEFTDWHVGMPCRAYYKPKSVIYEATIEEIDWVNGTALVSIVGYDVKFTANFNELYRSDVRLREIQISSAQKYKTEIKGTSNEKESAPPQSGSLPSDKSNPSVHPPGPSESGQRTFEFRPNQLNFDSNRFNPPYWHTTSASNPPFWLSTSASNPTFQQSTQASNPAFQRPRGNNIMQPNNEKEALACLLSSNYLSGYYAGYYDCLRKVPMRNAQDIQTDRQANTQLS